MPELAEVEFYRKQWLPARGQVVQAVQTHPEARVYRETDPQYLARDLRGRKLKAGEAHGKQLCFVFSEGARLGIHLGMSGKLLTAVPEIVPGRHDHLVLRMESTALVFSDYRKFGRVRYNRGSGTPSWWDNLPPQPQDPEFDFPLFKSILDRHPRRPLKALLLDQNGFPGIGNWMADEILWRSRIHPSTTGNDLGRIRRRQLFDQVKAVSRDALEVIGTDWKDPPESWLFPHRWKKGGICPASGQPLRYEKIGGRTTCFSPAIQKKKQSN
jgi:formamidopyrimidine-DNA glycosylase